MSSGDKDFKKIENIVRMICNAAIIIVALLIFLINPNGLLGLIILVLLGWQERNEEREDSKWKN